MKDILPRGQGRHWECQHTPALGRGPDGQPGTPTSGSLDTKGQIRPYPSVPGFHVSLGNRPQMGILSFWVMLETPWL